VQLRIASLSLARRHRNPKWNRLRPTFVTAGRRKFEVRGAQCQIVRRRVTDVETNSS